MDVPQVQYVDRYVDVPVVKQREVPMVQKVQRTVEVPQIQYVDRAVHVPQVKQRQVPMVQTIERQVDVPMVKKVEVPHVTMLERHQEVPSTQTVDRIVEVPMPGTTRQGPQQQTVNKVVVGRQKAPPQEFFEEVEGEDLPPKIE